MLLATTRTDGRPQISPVSGGVDSAGRIVISSYPTRAKTRNAERDVRASVLVLSDDWDGAWIQLDGDAEVLHMPEASEGLVEYFRCISGEHSDGNEYREALAIQQTDATPCEIRSCGYETLSGPPAADRDEPTLVQ